MQTRNNESGRSLIEMLAVIGIISMITIGAISGMQYGMQTLHSSSAFDLVETAARDVLDLFSWRSTIPAKPNFGDWICDNGIVNNCVSNGQHKDPKAATGWGEMEIIPVNQGCFEITLTNVPQRGCELLSNMTWRYVQHGTCENGAANWNCQQTNNITFFVN
jgi:type II secretory pathway pseudopilin PulG